MNDQSRIARLELTVVGLLMAVLVLMFSHFWGFRTIRAKYVRAEMIFVSDPEDDDSAFVQIHANSLSSGIQIAGNREQGDRSRLEIDTTFNEPRFQIKGRNETKASAVRLVPEEPSR